MRTVQLLGQPSRSGWRRTLGMATHNPARTIYGTVVTTAALAVESALDHESSLAELLITELVTVGVYWLAHIYAEYTSNPPPHDHGAAWRRLGQTAAHESSIVTASFVPLLVVVAVAVSGPSVATAATAGLWTGVALLFGWGVAVSRSSGRSTGTSLVYGLVSAAFGCALVALKAYLH